MSFSIAPVNTTPPVSQPSLNQPITQVINFTGNILATRGVGEHANVITIGIPPPSPICLQGPVWTARTASSSKRWRTTIYGVGRFIAVGLNPATGRAVAMYSDNKGVTWTESPTAFPDTFGYGFGPITTAYGNGVFFGAINAAQALRSIDGINWSLVTVDFSTSSVHFGGTAFVFSLNGMQSTCRVSNDGLTFTSRNMPTSDAWGSGAYGNGRHMLSATARPAYSDDDGVSWALGGAFPSSTGIASMAFGNGVWLAVPNNPVQQIFRSADGGLTWGTVEMGANDTWNRIKYMGGIFYITGQGGIQSRKSVDDGVTWVPANDTVSLLGSIYFDFSFDAQGYRYVAVGDGGYITSTVNSGICG
jgi:hypothetical protein